MTSRETNPIAEVLALSTREFRNMGLDYIAYIKPDKVDELPAFGVYGADGEKLAVKKTFEAAVKIARENDLKPVVVH